MKLKNRLYLIIIICTVSQILFNNALTSGQSIKNRKLRWADFTGKPKAGSEWDAYTYWFVYYKYDAPVFHGRRVSIKFKTWAELGSKSWVKRKAKKSYYGKRLLNHEQGHYDIGRICARDIKKHLTAYRYSRSGYKKEIEKVYNRVFNKYLRLEKRYDRETDHMKNKTAQKRWDRFFKKQLKLLENYR